MKKLIIYIPEDHQQLPYIDHKQYTEEDLSVMQVIGALEAAKLQVQASTHLHIMAQMAMETQQKQEEE